MSGRVFIGIDPGSSSGAMVTLCDDTVEYITFASSTERDVWDFLIERTRFTLSFCLIEKAAAMRGPDGRKQGVSSAFKFGQNYGFLRGLLVASAIRFEEVLPRQWQKEFGLVIPSNRGWSKTQKKNLHKQKAQQLFPSLKITHATADALLLATYAEQIRSKKGTEN